MKLLNTQLFNYQTDFNSFFKREKNFKLFTQVLIIVSSITIAILASEKVQRLLQEYVLRFFIPFRLHEYFTELFEGFLINNTQKYSNSFENVFTNHRRYIYGAVVIFSIENFRLLFKYLKSIRKWNKFSLSYGIYENKQFLRVKKELLNTLGNVLSFGVTIFLFSIILIIAIYSELQKSITFENSFLFEGVIFSFFFWIAFVVFYCLNIYQKIHNYYRNYLPNNKINQKKDAAIVIKSLCWHYLINLFSVVMIALNIPIDLFILFVSLKFIPWTYICSKTKKLFYVSSEELIYSKSRKKISI